MIEYSDNSTGLLFFTYFSGIQYVSPSMKPKQTTQTNVVLLLFYFPLGTLSYTFDMGKARALFLWSMISLNISYWFPSALHTPQIFYSITLAKYFSVVPFSNSTSYYLASSKGLSWALPTGFTRVPITIILTVDFFGNIFIVSSVGV